MKSVYRAVRTGYLNKRVWRFVFKWLMFPVGNYSWECVISIRGEHICTDVSITVAKTFQSYKMQTGTCRIMYMCTCAFGYRTDRQCAHRFAGYAIGNLTLAGFRVHVFDTAFNVNFV